MKINYMPVQEFVEKGFLQEANRRFFHPLGLALEVSVEDDGSWCLSGVWDYREDTEGIRFDLINSDKERIEKFRECAALVEQELEKHAESRRQIFKGCVIEPIPTGEKT